MEGRVVRQLPRNDQVFSLSTLASTAGVPADRFSSLTPDAVNAVPAAAEVLPQFVNSTKNNDTAVITIFSRYDRFSKEQQAFISYLRDTVLPTVRQSGVAANTYVGGDGAMLATCRRMRVDSVITNDPARSRAALAL